VAGDDPLYAPDARIAGTVYRIVKLLGRGGMGNVYDVEDTTVGKRYVMKTLTPELVGRKDLARRMDAEARILARLNHPNIVEVITAGTTQDELKLPFIVMERLNGQTLRTVLDKRGGLEIANACRIAIDLLDALEHAHEHGVIHRDVKPDNVFLHRNLGGTTTTKLLDFGIMRLMENATHETRGRFVGTLRYAAPEQIMARDLTPAADLYSSALVLYELLCGQGPYDAIQEAPQLSAAQVSEVPKRLSSRIVIPEALDRLVHQALEKDPKKRPKDAFTFAAELRKIQGAPSSIVNSSVPTAVPLQVTAAGLSLEMPNTIRDQSTRAPQPVQAAAPAAQDAIAFAATQASPNEGGLHVDRQGVPMPTARDAAIGGVPGSTQASPGAARPTPAFVAQAQPQVGIARGPVIDRMSPTRSMVQEPSSPGRPNGDTVPFDASAAAPASDINFVKPGPSANTAEPVAKSQHVRSPEKNPRKLNASVKYVLKVLAAAVVAGLFGLAVGGIVTRFREGASSLASPSSAVPVVVPGVSSPSATNIPSAAVLTLPAPSEAASVIAVAPIVSASASEKAPAAPKVNKPVTPVRAVAPPAMASGPRVPRMTKLPNGTFIREDMDDEHPSPPTPAPKPVAPVKPAKCKLPPCMDF
jgi:eukaryotic-like serine/threonine-protein kinase